MLQEGGVDAVFTDIRMPGLTGLELARVLSRFKSPPPVVFITAHDDHAVDAFELNAVDYVLKPVREDRLAEAVRRVVRVPRRRRRTSPRTRSRSSSAGSPGSSPGPRCSTSRRTATTRGCTRPSGSHLIRSPLTTLEEQWREAGFVRIHRSLLVALPHVAEVRMDSGRCTVIVGDEELAVSRRHTRELRDLLVRRARPGGAART